MLRIRDEQLRAFLPANDIQLVDFIAAHLKQQTPELVDPLPESDLRLMIHHGIVRARGHGLRRTEDLTAFVALMFEIAPNFDEQPAIRGVLRDATIPSNERMDRLFDRVPDGAWDEAERAYDPDSWFP
jgi:hypothetical protein